jgi:pimeloyl-ACP methyl ester carboxylesterase
MLATVRVRRSAVRIGLLTAIAAATVRCATAPSVRAVDVDEKTLREYAGAYRWGPDAFVYLQLWNEFTGFDKPSPLVAFDESGDVRTLYPTGRDQFTTGPGAAISTPVESRIEFQRDERGQVTSLTWHRERDAAAPRRAPRVETETREDVRFSNGDVQLAGTLLRPATATTHAAPAVILVHGSGPENREYLLPFARFLIRHGVAVLGYDKRGVGQSTGDWNTASFEDLAGDVIAAVAYVKTRQDIDHAQIGLLGISQAGWIMPLAAVRATDLAFLISISGAGVSPADTTLDQTRNELKTAGMPHDRVDQIVGLMKLQYDFARTGQGWKDYATARDQLAAEMGQPPPTFPGTPGDPYWQRLRRTYFYDPAPTLRQLRTPTLALFGELDNNILADKNKAAWNTALKAGGHRDYTLLILPKANHLQLEAKIGSNAEMASLQRFVPAYFTTINDWLAKHVRGFE